VRRTGAKALSANGGSDTPKKMRPIEKRLDQPKEKHKMKRNTQNDRTTQTETNTIHETNVLDFSGTLMELKKTVDPLLIRQRAGRRDRDGNVHMVEYVEWHTVADILDEHAPNWAHSVKDIRAIGDIITVTVAITIDGITREGIGTGRTASETGIKKAEHDALKRAAVKFGIARELYKREFDAVEHDEHSASATQRSVTDPMAKSLGDMLTAKQLGMIRGIARESGIDAEIECSKKMMCKVEELSKRGASELIDHLKTLQTRNAEPMRMAG
jgi:hypothetical protein